VVKVQCFSGHWQDGHIWPAVLVAVLVATAQLVDVCFVREIDFRAWQSLTLCLAVMAVAAVAIVGVGSAASYYVALYLIHRLTSKPRERDDGDP
jgi:hypothetical protein